MSVSGTIELLCYFESFRNVDLLEQGLYCVRAKVYSEKNTSSVATALTHYGTSSPVRKIDNPRHNILPSYQMPFLTFWVQFTEEVVDLNDAVHFRIEIPDLATQVLILELELCFSPEEIVVNIDQLKQVSLQKYRIKTPQRGLNQFYPVIFDVWHFSVVRFSLHTALIDFTYKPSIASFLRFGSFSSPSADNEQDRTDIYLFGLPCRRLLQDSYYRLSKNFQKLCVHVPAKQRASLGSDYFVPPPLTLSPTSTTPHKSASAPNTPLGNRKNKKLTVDLPSPNTTPSSPETIGLETSPQSANNKSENKANNHKPLSSLSLESSSSPLSQFSSSSASPLSPFEIESTPSFPLKTISLSKNANPITSPTTELTTSNISNGEKEDLTDTDDTDDNDSDVTEPLTSSSSSSTTTKLKHSNNSNNAESESTNSTENKIGGLKLFLLLNNVRDQNGIGSPRLQAEINNSSSGIKTSESSSPRSLQSSQPSQSSQSPQSPQSPQSTPTASSTSPLAPRFSASTGSRPSPRDCTAALSFFSRPTTPMSSATPTPNTSPLIASHSTHTVADSANNNNNNNNHKEDIGSNALRAKINSYSNVPLLAVERKTRKTSKTISVVPTSRPSAGPVPQDVRAKEVMTQIHHMGDQIFTLWARFSKVFHLVGKENTFRIAQKYEQKFLKLYRESVFREVAHVSNMNQMLELQANPTRHRQMVNSVRNSDYYKKLKQMRFEAVIERAELAGQPIILEQLIDTKRYAQPEEVIRLLVDETKTTQNTTNSTDTTNNISTATPPSPPKLNTRGRSYSSVNNPPKNFSGSHLYIMVHGLAGNPYPNTIYVP